MPALADPVSPTGGQNSAAPGDIQNQATAQYLDSADSSTQLIVSDIVKVTVAEIAGISAAPSATLPVNNNAGGAPTLYPTSTVYFDFVVKNEGNDPTKLFIPGAPSIATVGGANVTAGAITIINNNTVAPGTGTVTTTAPSTAAVPIGTGLATDSIPAGGFVTVRVPITIPFGTAAGAAINVTLGNTAGQTGAPTNIPFVVGANGTGGNDLYTQDNTGTTNGDTDGNPLNGDPSGRRQEASASQTAAVVVPQVIISGKVYDDGNNSAQGGFPANIKDGTEAGAIVTPPVFAVLVNSSNQVVTSTEVINNGTGTTTVNGTNGTYTFTGIDGYQNGLYVILSKTSLTTGTPVTAASQTLPAGWAATSPLIYPAFNVTNGDTPALAATYTGKDFGIEQLPNAVGATAASRVNPTGVSQFPVPATVFTGSTDPDGTVESYKITAFPTNVTTITINGITYTAASFATAVAANGGVTFTLAELNAGAVTVDPIDGVSTVSIPFQAIDNAGKTSANTANGLLPFSAANVTISGTVINDKDKSATGFTNILTPGETGTDTLFGTNGTPIYATLFNTDTNQFIASQVIPSTGLYSFSNVSANTNVKVIISTTQGTAGNAAPAAALTNAWVGTSPLESVPFNTGLFSIANKDFGVIQKAKLVIVKRITKINGQTTNNNDPANPVVLTGSSTDTFNFFNQTKNPTVPATYAGNWPAGYIVGATDAGKVKPGDFIEYTIYFLNNQGADAKNVKICDPIRGSQDYVPASTTLNLTSTSTAAGTAIADTNSRLSVFTGNAVPANCNMGAATSIGTNNGGVAIDITSATTALPDQPTGIPGATGVGTPNSYGMFRFRTQVKP